MNRTRASIVLRHQSLCKVHNVHRFNRVLLACCALLSALPTLADDGAEMCFPVYRRGKARPGAPDCEAKAATAPVDLGNYTCTADTELIKRYCKGECEVAPLQPVTDPDAVPFENGLAPVREDKLTPEMAANLRCLREKVAAKGGALSVTSAWRPQSYQDHLRELVVKHPKLIELAILQGVEECVPAPYYGAVHPDHVRHGPNRNAARTSPHTTGNAFDANWSNGIDIDALAGECGLFRPMPQPKSDGGDPIHFEPKPKQNMKTLTAASLALTTSITHAAAIYTPEKLGLKIVADGVHERLDDGTKVARYTFTIENVSAPLVRGFTIGRDSISDTSQPLLNDKAFAINSDWIESPVGWAGEVGQLEGTTKKMVEWLPANHLDFEIGLQPGQALSFSLRTHQAFSDLLKTRMLLGLKTFKYLEPPVVELKPLDQVAPTIATNLYLEPAPDRPGWLKVTASHGVYDNHDPYPEIILAEIDANQAISEKDVDAAVGTEANVFYVKQVNGRTYTVRYKALDASGNAGVSKNTFEASKK